MIHVFQRDCVLSQLVRVECLQANTLTHSRVTSFISDAPAYWVFFFWKERKNEVNKGRKKESRTQVITAAIMANLKGQHIRALFLYY